MGGRGRMPCKCHKSALCILIITVENVLAQQNRLNVPKQPLCVCVKRGLCVCTSMRGGVQLHPEGFHPKQKEISSPSKHRNNEEYTFICVRVHARYIFSNFFSLILLDPSSSSLSGPQLQLQFTFDVIIKHHETTGNGPKFCVKYILRSTFSEQSNGSGCVC